MARTSRTNKTKRDASRSPTEGRGVADGAVTVATNPPASDVPTVSSAPVTATTVRTEGFPRCRFCFKFKRVCDAGRPCGSCSRNKRLCRDPTQEDLDEFPERSAVAAPSSEQNVQKKKKHKASSSGTASRSDQQSFKHKQAAELTHCYRAINELLSDKYADCNAHFLYPVDHVALNLPHYRSIVEFPMDLSTIKEKMEDGEYRIAKEFKKDFMKVVNAARLFNEKGSGVYEAANRLQRVFDVVWMETKETVKKSDKSAVVDKDTQPEEEQSPGDV
ncbi:putative bdf1 transcription factor [Diaporthe ampelina]|uniref:Putative bdf1 transcription factor n=1 Tax=Diaporthe ampelina TaxID=1214573 RepID=A0A0G2HSA7_9PEZI|nr:putative bdf1 transcription factor [Diaporthe ampelina]